MLQSHFSFIFSSSPQVPSTPSAPFFEPFLAIDLQRNAKAFWHRKRVQMPPGGCSEMGALSILVPTLGNPGAVIEVPVIWVNCVLWTQTQRHTSLTVPPINNLYVYIEKTSAFNLISLLVLICLFILRRSAPCSKTSHFLNVR